MAKHNLTKDSLKIRNEFKCRIAEELDLNSIVMLMLEWDFVYLSQITENRTFPNTPKNLEHRK